MGVHKSGVYGSGVYKSGVYSAGSDDTVTIGGRKYKTVKIGDQVWLAENLDFKFGGLVVGSSGSSDSEPRANYYNNDESTYGVNGNKYGLLYNWAAVQYLEDNKSQFFPGWHVSSREDWDVLVSQVGGTSVAGAVLKAISGWDDGGNGNGDTNFNMPPSGYYYSNSIGAGNSARLWAFQRQRIYMSSSSDGVDFLYPNVAQQFSVRLVKDAPAALLGGPLLGSPNAEATDGE